MQKVFGSLICAAILITVQTGCDSGQTESARDTDVFQALKVESSNGQSGTIEEPVAVSVPARFYRCWIQVLPADAKVLIEPEPLVSSSGPGSYEFEVSENASFELLVTKEGLEKFQQVIEYGESDQRLCISLAPDFNWWMTDAQQKFESGDSLGAWSSLGVAKAVNTKNGSTEQLEREIRLALAPKKPEALEPGISPTEAEPLLAARQLIDAGDYDAAMLLIEDRLQNHPLDLNAEAARGYCLMQLGRIHESVQVLSAVIDQQPDHYSARFSRGVAMVEQFQPDEAMADLGRCLELTDEPAEQLHYYLGVASEQLGRSDEAIEHYSSALHIHPDHTASRLNRCILLLDAGAVEAAIEDATSILAKQPEHAVALNNRGVAYTARGETASAIDDFSAAIKSAPGYVEPRFNRAISYLNLHDYNESVEDFSVAIQRDPDEPGLRIGRARALMQLGEFQRASDDLAAAIEREPEDPDAIQLQQIVERSMNQTN